MKKRSIKKHTSDSLVAVPKTTRELLLFAISPYRKRASIFFVLTFLGVLCWSASTFMASNLINELSTRQDVTSKAWMIVGLFALFRVFDEVFWRLGEVVVRSFKPELIERVRAHLFTATLHKSHQYFVSSSSGRIAHWINKTADSVDAVINNTIWGVWGELLGLVLSTIFLFTSHWSLAVVFAVWMVALFTYNSLRGKTFSRLVEDESNERSKAAAFVVDSITNNQSVRVFNAREKEIHLLQKQQQRIVNSWRASWRFATKTNLVKGQSSAWVNVAAIVLAVWLFAQGTIEVGGLALFLAYFNSASTSLWSLAWYFDEYYRQFGTLDNALSGLEGECERMTKRVAPSLPHDSVSIKMSSLSFAYPEVPSERVIDNLNITIKAGEKIGIVGHSGAGKSTLVGLLLGFYEPTEGSIALNGIDIAAYDAHFMREMSAYVPQDTSMFNRTIKENVAYAKPGANDDEIWEALKKAHAKEFVERLPQGLNTMVGERGVKLSGGQRQRISIARAILKDAPLLLLDEATSALDSVSEQAIQKALHQLMQGRTAIVIAHRLSTLKHLDRIIVIEKGACVEQGTHDELIAIKNGFYADLWKRQKDGFIVE
jgi:ATP-binding cassette subfamily B protein